MGIESPGGLTGFEGEPVNGCLSSVEVEFDVVENLILFTLRARSCTRAHSNCASTDDLNMRRC